MHYSLTNVAPFNTAQYATSWNLTWAHDQWNYNDSKDEEKDEDDDNPQSDFQEDDLIQLSLYPAHGAKLKA